ncbi:hypothetical protein HDU81_009808 [Chytriomyces hyalinus]|nr:hypothetical protein HDU81_009808 [Chytriomyces hyalinus]
MSTETKPDSDHIQLLDAQERLTKIEQDIQPSLSQPSPDVAANPLSDGINLVLRMKPQPQVPPASQTLDENSLQNNNKPDSSTDIYQARHGSNDDTLSDFASDTEDDAVWDQALEASEPMQENHPTTEKEEQVDYLAMMERDKAIKLSESLENRGTVRWEEGWRTSQSMARVGNDPWEMGWKTVSSSETPMKKENAHWEAGWNIAEELMLGEIVVNEMGQLDPDEEVYSWEHKQE